MRARATAIVAFDGHIELPKCYATLTAPHSHTHSLMHIHCCGVPGTTARGEARMPD